jgi:hypothetical protein
MTYINHTNEELEFDIGQLGKQLSNAEDEVRRLKGQIEYAQPNSPAARRKRSGLPTRDYSWRWGIICW